MDEKLIVTLIILSSQVSVKQLSHVLTMCKGDTAWATNILLDSNKMVASKRGLRRVLSLPEGKRE